MITNRTGKGTINDPVKLLISNPTAAHVERPSSDWIILGTRPERVIGFIDSSSSFGGVVEKIRSLPGAYSLLHIDSDRGTAVRAYRGITSSFNVFYCRRPQDGAIVVGDHFRNVLSELPVSARTVPSSVPPDQLLLGTRPTGTYVEEVGRLAHGERLDWPLDGSPDRKLLETVSTSESITVSEAKRKLDRYFRGLLTDDYFDGSVATMLSGGVDSTLLHTYLDTDSAVTAAFDSPEFEFEVEYAREASDMLRAKHNLLMFDEDEYLEHLEATIDATGLPLLLPQATLMRLAFSESPHRTYVNGGLADGLFGTGTAALAHLARYTGRASRFIPNVTWEVEALKRTAERLRRPATDPDGSAMNFRIHSHPDRVATFFDQETVDERKRVRLRYTRRRVDIDDRSGYASHMHLGHGIEYFHDNILTIWRHAAHASGKALLTPFAGREVAETVLALPPSKRYARFALPSKNNPTQFVQYKYLLKDLLDEKLPEYDTGKPKGHGLLPTGRYLSEGPLSSAFERYSVPEFVPERYRDSLRDRTDNLAWYALNYAVWRDRILNNSSLDPLETTAILERQTV